MAKNLTAERIAEILLNSSIPEALYTIEFGGRLTKKVESEADSNGIRRGIRVESPSTKFVLWVQVRTPKTETGRRDALLGKLKKLSAKDRAWVAARLLEAEDVDDQSDDFHFHYEALFDLVDAKVDPPVYCESCDEVPSEVADEHEPDCADAGKKMCGLHHTCAPKEDEDHG